MTRPEGSEWLFGLQPLGMTLGLDRIGQLLAGLGDPQKAFRSLLVGGTNGKGSCASALARCLQASGESVGLFTSPHLSRLGERFRVDGEEAGRAQIEAAIARVRPAAERIEASFFEVVTALGCLLFEAADVDIAVMEVGLGGRFDATNALEPELSIVTGVALDHTAQLGGDPRQIAFEKAGILRPGKLSLTGARGPALEALRERANELAAPLWAVGDEIELEGEELAWDGVRLSVRCPAGEAGGVAPLVGRHQIRNLSLSACAALALGVTAPEVANGLAATSWPGRLERLRYRDRWLVFDGAHNPAAARVLSETLRRLGAQPFTLVVGAGRDKDLSGMASRLAAGASRVIATSASNSPRARSAGEVADHFAGLLSVTAEAVSDPQEALSTALEATPAGGTVVVAGSLYLVGELRPVVTGEELETFERWQ